MRVTARRGGWLKAVLRCATANDRAQTRAERPAAKQIVVGDLLVRCTRRADLSLAYIDVCTLLPQQVCYIASYTRQCDVR